jgi:hypothetical protein
MMDGGVIRVYHALAVFVILFVDGNEGDGFWEGEMDRTIPGPYRDGRVQDPRRTDPRRTRPAPYETRALRDPRRTRPRRTRPAPFGVRDVFTTNLISCPWANLKPQYSILKPHIMPSGNPQSSILKTQNSILNPNS